MVLLYNVAALSSDTGQNIWSQSIFHDGVRGPVWTFSVWIYTLCLSSDLMTDITSIPAVRNYNRCRLPQNENQLHQRALNVKYLKMIQLVTNTQRKLWTIQAKTVCWGYRLLLFRFQINSKVYIERGDKQ